ncbi:MAG: M13 family metallopeptidase [Chitinophagaceae bacterium]|nr:M13 family metallopeptidase [Chitinophagaceae bacterium]MBP9740776.1 M13 family metallopeptidase [Chitinophagaceae bacterium]
MKKILSIAALLTVAFVHAQDVKMKYIDPANMNLEVKPGDNFYQYANGNWIKNNPVPASKTRWGSFDELREESSKRLQGLLEFAAINTNKDRKTQIIGDFYTSGIDSLAIEAKGFTPIIGDLARINSIANNEQLQYEIATLRTKGLGSPLFGAFVGVDRKNVTQYIVSIGQGGTTLPDRDYYLKNDARSLKIREAYQQYITKMFMLIGENNSAAVEAAKTILEIETVLAKAQYSRVEMRDPYKTYNKLSIQQLNQLTSLINWNTSLKEMQLPSVDSVIVSNPSFLKEVNHLLTNKNIDSWKVYLKWSTLKSAAPYLSSAFVNTEFEFNSIISGQKAQTPRWQRMSSLIDRTLSDFIGELYVEKYFKPEAKQRMLELVKNLQTAFAERISKLDWMSAETKAKALEKLAAITNKIAYPDKWKTYDGLTIDKNNFFDNIQKISIWQYNFMLSRLGTKVDKTQWGMTPPTVNASYSPSNNDITFPAGILQFPFFDFGADDAVNYGGIGAVIGHEITHGFDDQGRQYAADGNLKDWWTKEDGDKFKTKANEVVEQYNALTVLDTIHVNGRLTLGENLADLGGLNMAFEAFKKTKEFKKGKKIDGFTPTQRFFLSWAQVWRNNVLPETSAQLILTDPHSPGLHRGNGPIVNMDVWYKAFNVQPGDKLYKKPEDRTYIW